MQQDELNVNEQTDSKIYIIAFRFQPIFIFWDHLWLKSSKIISFIVSSPSNLPFLHLSHHFFNSGNPNRSGSLNSSQLEPFRHFESVPSSISHWTGQRMSILGQSYILILTEMDAYELDKEFQINSAQQEGYYHEYCRLFLANIALTNQVKQLLEEKGQLSARLSKYEDDEFASQSDRNAEKGKRMRRNADEIERYYKCTVKSCAKSYGSEGSLNQHYKLKHLEIYLALPNIQAVREEADDKENRRKLLNKPR